MDPAAVADMEHTEKGEELMEMFGPLGLEKKELILFPINNNLDPKK